jgi:hypothetical protein
MPVESVFTKRLPNSEERVKISEATFDDEFCIHVTGFASDGEHVVEIAVYDASGRETARIISPVEAKGAKWGQGFCPRAIKDIDAPGEWWFVVTLDDAPVVSASMLVKYGKPKASMVVPPARAAAGSQGARAKH